MASSLRDRWTLEPDLRFLNHGSFGACPTVVLEEQARLRARLERQPVQFMARDLEGLLDEARVPLAELVGADADDLAFVPNATHGFNTVLRSLSFAPGDEILATSHGYNAARTAATFAAERAGATLVEAPVPFPLASADEVVAALEAAFTPATRLLLIDHITSPTGLVLPLERLLPLAKERSVDVLVDGAHAPGMVEIDLARLAELGATYYTGSCHKWLCSPKGAAFLWVRPDRQDRIRPLAISHGANDRRTDRSRFRLELDWTGSDDPTAYLCVPAAIEFLAGLFPDGWEGLRTHNRGLALEGRRLLCEALEVEAPAPEDMIANLGAVILPSEPPQLAPGAPEPLQAALLAQEGVEVPVLHFAGQRVLRISAQAYNDLAEYQHLASALPQLLS